MYCPKCGTQKKDKNVYCEKCGCKLPVLKEETQSVLPEPITEVAPEKSGTQDLSVLSNEEVALQEVTQTPSVEEKSAEEKTKEESVKPVEVTSVTPVKVLKPVVLGGNGCSVAGFIFSFFMPLLGLIFGIAGVVRAKKLQGKGRVLGILSILFSLFFLALILLPFVAFIALIILADYFTWAQEIVYHISSMQILLPFLIGFFVL